MFIGLSLSQIYVIKQKKIMARELEISHAQYGNYKQTVFPSINEAGHRPLASEGKYGWGMPSDPATEAFVKSTRGKVVLEIGCGLGDTVALPALAEGARMVFATDISPEHFARDSILRRGANEMGRQDALRTWILKPTWWDQPLLASPTTTNILLGTGQELPPDHTVDRMMARHSLQFGDPDGILRFFDLAATALKPGGAVTAINFTPYTQYMYNYDQGHTMQKIAELNDQFGQGEINTPGGYIHSIKGPIQTSLARLMGKSELDRGEENTFLYFDHPTVVGLLRLWGGTREERGLPVNLELQDSTYFTPPIIAEVNKLVSVPELVNRENFVFTLTKV